MRSGHAPPPAGGPEAIPNARARRAKRIPGARLRTAATLLVLAAATVAFLQYDGAGTFLTGDWIVAPSVPEWQQVLDAMPGYVFAQVANVFTLTAAGSITDTTSLELDGATSIATFESEGSRYAVIAAYDDSGIQMLDITDPTSITATDSITDTADLELDAARDIAIYESGTNRYAVIAAYDDNGIQILDITDPDDITAAGSITDDAALKIGRAWSVAVFKSGATYYAAVAAFGEDAVQILDITDPTSITATDSITDTADLELDGALEIVIYESGGSRYAVVTGYTDDGVQMLDITDPDDIIAAGSIPDTTSLELDGARGIAVFESGGSRYAAVAAENDDGVQILDITDPDNITAAGSITDTTSLELDGTHDIDVFESGGSRYAAVTAHFDDGVQMLDITDPDDITAAGSITDTTSLELNSARGIDVFESGGSRYAAVTGFSDDGVQILRIGNATANAIPVLASIGTRIATELAALSFTATASDDDAGDTLTFSLGSGAPTGASITPGGVFSWTPTEVQDGTHDITIEVSDGAGGSDSEDIVVDVAEINVAPVLDPVGAKSASELEPLAFTVTASDDDVINGADDTLVFSLIGTPPTGASITPDGAFSWTPAAGQAGSHTVTIRVSDGAGLTDSEGVPVAVQAASDTTPPTFVSSGLDLSTGVLTITFSEEIDATPATNVVPTKIHVRESGSYTGGITLAAGELGTAADGATISFTLISSHLTTVAGLTEPELTIEPGAVRDASDNLIDGTFDVSTAVFVDAFSVSSEETDPTGITFSSDGTRMFVIGYGGDEINEYALSTAFDASTAAHVDATSVSSEEANPTGMAFSNDGTKMFVIGDVGDEINEYALSTAFDVSTAAHVDAFSVSLQESTPQGMAFSSDGAKMFVIGSSSDKIHEYALSTPFDASTAAHVDATSVRSKERIPTGMAFSSDGAKMFVIGNDGEEINEYTLSTPFDASTAAHVDATSVSSWEADPQGMAFSSDGAKMFIVGVAGDDVNEYDLHSVYPITVTDPPPTFVSSELDSATGALTITFSEDIDVTPATNVVPTKIHIRESGSYTGGITLSAGELGTAADGATISFTLTSSHLATVAGLTEPELTIEPGAVRDASDNLIVGTFDASTAVFVDAFSVSSEESEPQGMAFSSDGARMFVIGSDGDEINEYTLSTAFDASTAAHADATSVSSWETSPQGMAFSSDGAKMFVVGSDGDDINEYTLSTAFDASTATFVDAFSVSSQEIVPAGMAFSSDGAKMFVVGFAGVDINEYALSTAFDASTAVFVDAFSVSSQEAGPRGMAFSSDGAKMFVIGSDGDEINEYTLSTAFDASTAVFVDATRIRSQDTSPQGMAFSSDGAKMFVVGFVGKDINEYTLSSVYSITVTGMTTTPPAGDFVTTWETTSANEQIRFKTTVASGGNFTVDWGDGSVDTVDSDGRLSHTYADAGSHTVTISGDLTRFFPAGNHHQKLQSIDHWGSIGWTTMESAFKGASNMEYNATDKPDLSSVTDMGSMFSGAADFNGDISSWDVSSVTDMGSMFSGAAAFNGDISSWNVSGVTNTSTMFQGTTSFSGDISSWNVSSVTDMGSMFSSAAAFNGDISSWDVSSVTDMRSMFQGATFSGDISSWDVSSVTDMGSMFKNAAFNQPLNSWNVSSVTDMGSMFSGATSFNRPLNGWSVSQVTYMGEMFRGATSFNQDISSWNVSGVTSTSTMFQGATSFNQPLNDWDVSSVELLYSMFEDATSFNKPLNDWDVSAGSEMGGMFKNAAAFNGDISSWSVSSVTDMEEMFKDAISFNGDISSWNVSSVEKMAFVFANATSFNQNLGKWYIVPADTAYDTAEGTLNATTISAQNIELDGHAPNYGIGTGDNSNLFNMTGSTLMFKNTPDAGEYTVTVTAPGADFGTDNHRVLDVTVTDSPPTFVSSELDSATGVLTITFSEEIDVTPATQVDPTKIHVRESGSYTGGITLSAGELGTTADGATISFTLTASHLATVTGLTEPELTIEPGAVQDASDNLIVGTFDVSTAVFVDAFSVSSQENAPRGMAFSSDGAKMFVVGFAGEDINEYTLSTAFDASTAAFVDAFSVSSQEAAPRGMAFSSDGAKMFVVGSTGLDINEYTLSTAFDVSTAEFVDAFSVSSQETAPQGMAFSSDGAKMFVIGSNGDEINEYALSTAFDASTATFVDAFSVSSKETAPTGMAFSSDGAKMFVVGSDGDDVNEYALSTAFDASTATFVDAFSVSSQETSPQGMAFSSDGAKMFVIGTQGDDVNEYDLHSVYPITVIDPPPTFVSSELDSATGVLTITFSEEIDATPATNVVPAKIHIRESGSYTGGITLAAGELGTTADGATISFTLTASHLATVAGLTTPELTIEPGAVRDTSDNLIVGTFDVSTAAFVDATSVSSQDSAPTGMAFSSDGAKMFVAGGTGRDINEYTLSTAFDASTATFVDAFSVSSQDSFPADVAFSNDGAKMFVVGSIGHDINEYALSTAFDASTATFVDAFSVSPQETAPTGMAFSSDGAKMFVTGSDGDDVNEYALSTAFDASTATFVDAFSVSSEEAIPQGMAFSSDGAKMFVIGTAGDDVNEYALSTAFDASTATFVDAFSVSSEEATPQGMAFSSDGAKMFVVGFAGDDVNEYDLHSAYPITVTGTYTPPAGAFATTWDATASPYTVRIPLEVHSGETLTIDWGDGTSAVDVTSDGTQSHTYSASGEYQVNMTGGLARINLAASGSTAGKLASIDQWGDIEWTTMREAFRGASNMVYGATDAPDLSGVSSTQNMFRDAETFDGDLSGWDVSGVTTMEFMFYNAGSFNQDLSSWNTANVTDTSFMFGNAGSFNQDLPSWNTASVTDMRYMFDGAAAFEGDISGWDVSSVTDMSFMFSSAAAFEGDISGWDVSSVVNMEHMFSGATTFNSDISSWNVSAVTNMLDMFSDATAFNQDISSWNVSAVTNMLAMFSGATSFHQNLGEWYVVPDSAEIARTDVPGVVGSISAQNSYLDIHHSPTYGIGTGGDSALFEIVSGNGINMTAVQTKSAYGVNVTASGTDVFENGNNWLMVDVTVTGQEADTTPPTIFLRGLFSSVEIEVLTPYVDEGADCEDDVDGAITPTVVNTVNVNQVGTYTVTYSCSDAANNDAEDVSRTVTVSDTTPPVITLIGPNPVYVTVGTSYTDAGATCTDNYDGAITPQGGIGVDPSQVGTYTVTYNCFDSESNSAPSVSRTVIVQEESDTTPPTFVSSALDGTTGVLTITFSEDIDVTPPTNVDPAKIHVRESGSYTGGITLAAGELGTTADGATVSFTLTSSHLATVAGLTEPELTIEPGAVQDASDNLIVGTFDLSTAVFVDATSVASEDNDPRGMTFSNDGTKMFVAGNQNDKIYEYTLATAFDVSTAAIAGNFSVSSEDNIPTGVAFSNDGTKMFVVGLVGMAINEYTLATAFDVSTATHVNATPVSGESDLNGVAFSNDGTKMFAVGSGQDKVYEYTLTTAFDVSTAGITGNFSIFSEAKSATDMAFSNDGTKMFVVGQMGDSVDEYTLATAFDVSTAAFAGVTFSVSSQEDIPHGMAFSNDGAKMFVIGTRGGDVNEYDLHSVYSITVTNTPPSIDAGPNQRVLDGSAVALNGTAADADGDSMTYSWAQTGGSPAVTLTGSDTLSPTFTAPDVSSDVQLTFQLTVNDGTDSVTDTVTVTIHDAAADFVTTWSVTGGLTIPVRGTGDYDVDWGDGTFDSSWIGTSSHIYDESGPYTVRISGDFPNILLFQHASASRLQSIEQWGDIGWTDMEGAFRGASNMEYNAADAPDLSSVTDMDNMFAFTGTFGGNLSGWDVSGVTNMQSMFLNSGFNGDISGWDVSGVTNMFSMFQDAPSFDSDISSWDVSSVSDMTSMFLRAAAFNQPLDSWDVSNVQVMGAMFRDADSFNQDISSWDVSSVTDMRIMFNDADSFNQDISSWNVSSVAVMSDMFSGATSFEQNLGKWYVTLDYTIIARTDVPGVVGSISAQNGVLDGHSPTYGIGTGGDSALFDIVNGNELNMTSVEAKSAYTVNVTASGSNVFESGNNWREVDVTVIGQANAVPVLGSIGPKSVSELAALTFTATATDDDTGDTLTFTLGTGAPTGASITSGGAFSWTPTEEQDGTHGITIDVSDGNGGSDSEAIAVAVAEVNVDPALASVGSRSVNELGTLTFTASASDGDIIGGTADTLEFSLAGAPAGASINSATGVFSWITTEQQDGLHTITIQVRDGVGATDSEDIAVTVAEVPTDPVLNPIGPKSVNMLEELTFTATASDVDVISGTADTLVFSLASGPTGASITQSTGLFSWTPTASQTGTHTITVQVEDGAGATDSEAVTITVTESNENPTLNSIGPKSVNELAALIFTATASDDDAGDTLEFTLVGTPPTGASITPNGAFSWTPTERQDGTHSITVRVSDGNGGTASETVTVTVNEIHTSPVLGSIGPQGVNRPGTLTFTAAASDGDVINGADDALEFSLTGAPTGASMDSATGIFSWTPTAGQVGTHTVTVTVTDGAGESDSETVTMTVTEGGTNAAPVLDPIGPQSVDETVTLEFPATANDDDGDSLTFSLEGDRPRGASITSGGAFSWTPDQSQDGDHSITVRVSDGRGGTDSETVAITVHDIAPLPVSARATSQSITLTLSEVVTSSGTGPNGFLVEGGGDPVSVDSITGSGTKSLVLGLTGSISAPATLSYSDSGDVQDENNNPLASFADLAVSFQSKKSRSVSPPAITADSQGYASSAIPEWAMQAAPEGPLQPVPADGTPYPLIIDENGYALHSSPGTVIPTQVAAGQTVTIKVTIHDPTPIAYFAIYLNLQGNDISHLDSDAQIIWDSGQAYVVDRSGLMQDVAVTMSEDPDDPARKTATITVTFSDGMGETNMVIRTWNAAGQIAEVKIFDALDVRTQEPEPVAVDPEPGTEPNTADPEPGAVPVTAPGVADSQSAAGPDADRDTLAIRMWSGFEPESISDAQLLASLGLDYPGVDIPSWVMTELGPLVAKGDITVSEFKTALEYVLEHVLEHS